MDATHPYAVEATRNIRAACKTAGTQYRQQQFDLLADGVRGALDLDAVYAAMGLENPRRNAPVSYTHLDGYADTCDALSSYGDREKKLEILKDPHCGAFAVIRLCSYFAAYLALCVCVDFTPRVGLCWTLALVLERALSGLAVASFPMAKNTGLVHTFATAADRTTVRRVLMVLAALLSAALLALGGWALVLAALLVFARYHVVSDKQFGGITGDLAGWFLQKAEPVSYTHLDVYKRQVPRRGTSARARVPPLGFHRQRHRLYRRKAQREDVYKRQHWWRAAPPPRWLPCPHRMPCSSAAPRGAWRLWWTRCLPGIQTPASASLPLRWKR